MQEKRFPNALVTRWLYLGIVMILAMVVIGGMTRLTHSGLSMTSWSFGGSLPPMNEVAWQNEFSAYQQSPEYKELHSHFALSEFKSIYWWEYIHRMWGRLIGIVFIVPFVFFLFKRWIPKALLPHFLVIFGLGVFQAFLGWFMVKSGLVDVPRVSHFRLAAHLSTAFFTCSYVFWVANRYRRFGSDAPEVDAARPWAITLGAAVFVQIVYGAFVAGLRSGWIHNTWPLMDGSFIAPAATALEPFIANFIDGRSGVQFVHRTLGMLVVGLTFFLLYKSKDWQPRVQRSMQVVSAAVVLQFILGVLTLLLEVPVVLGVLHQVLALIVLLSIVQLIYESSFASAQVKVLIK